MLERSITSEGLIVSVIGADKYPVVDLFDNVDLQEGLLRGIYTYGFEKPSAVQQRGIRPVLDGRDTIGQAQSGTGKTATFVIETKMRSTPQSRSLSFALTCRLFDYHAVRSAQRRARAVKTIPVRFLSITQDRNWVRG